MKCSTCEGTGRIYCVAYYYGVAECGSCEGSGEDPETICVSCGRTWGEHIEDNCATCDFMSLRTLESIIGEEKALSGISV